MRPKLLAIINYGMGNLGSISNALEYLGGKYIVSDNPKDLPGVDGFVLPGVGSFGAAMDALCRLDLIPAIENEILRNGKPILGICLGLQLLAQDSSEGHLHHGLGWIPGHVTRLAPEGHLHVPHVGWNTVRISDSDPLFAGIAQESHFYFDHSYHLAGAPEYVTATCDYGGRTVAAIRHGNIFATQFHPEKSQRNGLKLLRNYLNIVNNS